MIRWGMLPFCSKCGTMTVIDEFGMDGEQSLFCMGCEMRFNIVDKIVIKTMPKVKEIDYVLGGADAWKNVDTTEVACPKCAHSRAYFMQVQTRSADEPSTTFYRCCECTHQWKEL